MMPAYKYSRRQKISGAVLLAWFVLFTAHAQGQYAPHITQIDKQAFPLIRVYVSVTDEKGNPIPDDQPVDLFLYEDGKEVSRKNLSTGWAVSSVLVLDVSGSMNDPEKLQKAKEAAIRYVEMAGQQHQVALVVFNSSARVVCKFGTERYVVTSQTGRLTAQGGTALQDGIGLALDLLRGRPGRRVVVAITDGIENSSKKYLGEPGISRLLNIAKNDGSSVYIVGLGHDVNDSYLRRYQGTGGTYFFSPSPNQLKSIFEKTISLLAKETVFEYTTVSSDRDGMTPKISVELKVKNEVTTQESSYTKTGVIPHVRGDHFPYLLLCLVLLVLPKTFSLVFQAVGVIQFRLSSIERLSEKSDAIKNNLRDRNVPDEDEYRFKVGGLVVKCPAGCPRVYHVRSWRLTKCHCICGGGGPYCFASLLPKWLRKTLDFLSRGHVSQTTGRSFLCRCADDSEGF